jgi:probable HAF family extracellular repeat protein
MPFFTRVRRCLGAPLLSLLLGAPAFADPLYTMNFMPTGFAPSAINNAGQIAGTWNGAAAILSAGGITSLAGVAPGSYGLGINDRGDVAGAFDSRWSGNAFAYVGGSLRQIGPLLAEDHPYSNAVAINNAGIVAGNAYPFVGEAVRGYVYDKGTVRLIPTFGGDWSNATAINASGAVVGTATLVPTESVTDLDRHAYIDTGGIMRDLGTLGGLRSEAYDINDAGLVVGWSETDINPDGVPLSRPFLYRDGALLDLGSLGGYYGYARAINNLGVVVGESDIVTDLGWGSHAFFYQDGRMIDLNALVTGAGDWEIVDARDINDAGQILARACRLGSCTDVRLDMIPAVPEPSAWVLLLGGLGLLAMRGRRRLAPALAALLLPAVALAEPLYSATFLPANFQALGIDDAGRITGSGSTDEGGRAFVWSAGELSFLPTLGGPSAYGTAITGNYVTGSSISGDVTRAFVYSGGTIQRIGTLYGGDSYGYAVNAAGQVVGESTDAFGNSRAFLYSGGVLTDIGTLGGPDARARGINDLGMIVGGSSPGPAFPDDGAHAFLYRDGLMQDLGTLGGGFSWANAINNAGQVAGYSLIAGDAAFHPFLYSGGTMIDLGAFGGDYAEARALNEAGLVVGLASLPGFGFSHAFLYADGQLLDLNTLVEGGLGDFTLTEAVGINELGQIAANGCNEFGFCAPVLLSPVPEPAQLLLLLAGLPLLGRRLRLDGRLRGAMHRE